MASPTIFGREPAAILASVTAVLSLLVGFGALEVIGLSSAADVGIVGAVLAAISAIYLAFATNESLLAPIVQLFKAGAALGAIYGLNLSAEESGLAILAIEAVFTAWHRDQVVPLTVNKTFARVEPEVARTDNYLAA